MKLLIDTHILLWFLEGESEKMSPLALSSIVNKENEKYISIASLWEVAIKINIGKLRPKSSSYADFRNLVALNGFEIIHIEDSHLLEYLSLPLLHRDPFDRILIAQAIREGFQIVTKDPNIFLYDKIKTIW